MRIAIAYLAALLMASSAITQTPAAQLEKPPANARHFVILSTAGKHGDSWSWTLPDGTRKAMRPRLSQSMTASKTGKAPSIAGGVTRQEHFT